MIIKLRTFNVAAMSVGTLLCLVNSFIGSEYTRACQWLGQATLCMVAAELFVMRQEQGEQE